MSTNDPHALMPGQLQPRMADVISGLSIVKDAVINPAYVQALEARLAAAEKDAERYRWLRTAQLLAYRLRLESFEFPRATWQDISADALDAAIDAARDAVNSRASGNG